MSGSGIGTLITEITSVVNENDNRFLFTISLRVAQILGSVRMGVATGGSVTTLEDNNLEMPSEFYSRGTLWILSGDHIYTSIQIDSFSDGVFTFDALDVPVLSGVRYAVGINRFPLSLIVLSINTALASVSVPKSNIATLSVNAQNEYALPAGVANVKNVEIAQSLTTPYGYQRKYGWRVADGYLYFDTRDIPGSDSLKIRLWYMGKHDNVYSDTDTISSAVNLDWLVWASVVNLLRDNISIVEKDSPITMELLNEAVSNEKIYKTVMLNSDTHAVRRTPILG